MALTVVEQLRLELGLNYIDEELLSEAELEYFLDKNKLNIRRSAVDAAKTILFILSQRVHERSGTELEIWGHTWFENYMATLKLYLSDPNYSIALTAAKAYSGGISVSDIRDNIENADTVGAVRMSGIPTDSNVPCNLNNSSSVFDSQHRFSKNPFSY